MATLLSMYGYDNDDDFVESGPVSGPTHKPQTIAALDVRQSILEDIALKTLYLSGSLSVLELSNRTQLSYEVANELFCKLRAELLCQVTGMTGNIPQIAITSRGRLRAVDLLSSSQYVATAPVSFESYVAQVRKQSVKKGGVHAEEVHRAFAHLVVDDETLRQVLAEDEVWIPYAVEIDGQIITVYDPAIHLRIPELEPENHDARWVLCHRPRVLVGGELTAEMLDMQFNPTSKFYVGPVQMKANNGVLIIDDFGRQRVRPEELLNRWIVPLDRRVDYLTLAGGKTIEIPFELLVVFASNMDPNELMDPAFMRRIQTKIKIGAVPDKQFCEIFRRVATESGVAFDAEIPNLLIGFVHDTMKQELRSCYPRDIVNQVCWAAQFEDREPYLDRAALNLAIESYFVKGS